MEMWKCVSAPEGAALPPLHPAPHPGLHRQPAPKQLKQFYLINATSRQPEVRDPSRNAARKGEKICLDPSGSPQPHLHASERAPSSSCFFYQAHRHSKLVRLDSSVNVGYSEAAAAGAPLLVSPVPGQAPAHLHMALDKHGSHSTTAWS